MTEVRSTRKSCLARQKLVPVQGHAVRVPKTNIKPAECLPDFARQRAEGRDILAYLVEHKGLHDARSSVY